MDVQGLPISPNTIVYYYVYGSVKAALSRPTANQCEDAMKTMQQVRTEPDNKRNTNASRMQLMPRVGLSWRIDERTALLDENDLTLGITQAQKEKRATEKEIESFRDSLRALQKVKI